MNLYDYGILYSFYKSSCNFGKTLFVVVFLINHLMISSQERDQVSNYGFLNGIHCWIPKGNLLLYRQDYRCQEGEQSLSPEAPLRPAKF